MTAVSNRPETNRPETTTVLGFPIQILDSYADWLSDRLTAGDSIHVVTLNAEMAIAAEKDPILAEVIHKADLVIPDGAGVVLYLKLRGKRVERCPGIELSEEMLRRAGSQGWPVYFYGGKPDVADAAAIEWHRRSPGIKFIGVSDGYIQADAEAELLTKLEREQPKLILVGLGVPRQEQWIQKHRQVCPNAIWIGCGGSFDIWSGNKERAPKFFCDNNLEWVYRLYQEPWRWKRMLALPLFAWKAMIGQ